MEQKPSLPVGTELYKSTQRQTTCFFWWLDLNIVFLNVRRISFYGIHRMPHYLLLLPGTSRHSPKWGWTTQKKTITFAYVAQGLDNMQIQLLFTNVIASLPRWGRLFSNPHPAIISIIGCTQLEHHKGWKHFETSCSYCMFCKRNPQIVQIPKSGAVSKQVLSLYPGEKIGGMRHLVLAKSVRYHHSTAI